MGSVSWCWQTIELLKWRWKRKDFTDKQFEETLSELHQHRVFEAVPPEQPYGSLEALLEAEIGCTELEAFRHLRAAKPKLGRRPYKCRQSATFSQRERATANQISHRRQQRLDYVAVHAPDLFQAVQSGTLTIWRAFTLAKGQPPETPLTTLHRVWRNVDPRDRLQFLIEMLTPTERRALMLGFVGEEDEP